MFSNCTKQKREKQRRNSMNLCIILNIILSYFFITVQINEKEKKEQN